MTVPRALLAAASTHRAALRRYLSRCCEACGNARVIMLLMESDDGVWWICSRCYCDRYTGSAGLTSEVQ